MLKLKFLLPVFIVYLLFFSSTPAQEARNPFVKGAWEVSFVGGFSSIDSETDYTYGGISRHYSTSSSNFCLAAMPGYYIFNGISVEPEIQMTVVKDEEPAYSGIIGAAYTYFTQKNNLGIFLKAGAGLSNSITALNIVPYQVRVDDGFNVKIYQFSTGLKILLSEDVLIRTELEYKTSSYKNNSSYYSETDNTYTELLVRFGLSVLL